MAQRVSESTRETNRHSPASALDPTREELPRLAHDAVHEVRNMLVVVQAYLASLDERYDDPSFRRELQGFIAEAAGRVEDRLDKLEAALQKDDDAPD